MLIIKRNRDNLFSHQKMMWHSGFNLNRKDALVSINGWILDYLSKGTTTSYHMRVDLEEEEEIKQQRLQRSSV